MALAVNDILTDVRTTLNDLGTTKRWSEAVLLGYLNAAQRQIALVRPDASSKTEVVQLVAGTKQTLPSGGLRLLDVVRNMGANGSTPGYPVNRTDRKSLNEFNRGWHMATPATAVKSFMLDDLTAKTYYVSPPVHGSTQVHAEIVYSVTPTNAALGGNITLDDIFENPLKEWMLHLALATELTSTISQANSRYYAQMFANSLGLKGVGDKMTSPNPPSQQPGGPLK